MEDGFRHRGQRKRLIEQLRAEQRYDERVLEVMGGIPRHAFLESSFNEWAYRDEAFPIDCEQTISQPSTVAWQSSALQLLPRQKVLEIGTGSGYQAAVLSLLGEEYLPWNGINPCTARQNLPCANCAWTAGSAFTYGTVTGAYPKWLRIAASS